jgi:bifunctional DNA-binding transcriptional regulator/antitoxin component of YhaV-PrlF toxin-antitoxin module
MTTTIQINTRGTLTLPKPLRQALGLTKGGMVVAETSVDGIVLKPSATFPIEIYSDERVAEFDKAESELARHLKRKQK